MTLWTLSRRTISIFLMIGESDGQLRKPFAPLKRDTANRDRWTRQTGRPPFIRIPGLLRARSTLAVPRHASVIVAGKIFIQRGQSRRLS
jgi:hypothetical protein